SLSLSLSLSLSQVLQSLWGSGGEAFRLVGGSHCSGRVEVLHGESWVTVCDADFNQQDAEVVCRELGCGSPVEVLEAAAFGRGEGQVWSEELQCRGNESQIHFCPKSSSLKHNCSHDNDVGLVCADSVRLVDGGSRCAGRVEVLHRGQWGTVCSNNWVMSNAAVVCRELGCGESVDALSDSEFGPGSGQIWMNYVDCNGSESTLKNCRAPGWGVHNCDHSKDAGVICSGRFTLVGGSHCSGRVEVLHKKSWVTVCDADFNQQDAEVVCRELGCGSPVEVLGAAAFGRGEGQVWSEELQCRGNESQIHFSWGKHDCDHSEGAGVICSGIRLVGGSRCSGRVEVLHGESWVTVCDADFDQQDAEVVCRELGCGSPVEVLGAAAFGRGEGQVWSEELQCRGNESQIHFCPKSSSLKHNCSHDNDVGLVCSGKHNSVRLMDGGSRCAGRVEVLHRGEWGTVCDWDNWDMKDAAVVCRELGCGEVVETPPFGQFGSGLGPIWMFDVNCRGPESTLKNCRSAGWGKHDCDHTSDSGIVCSGKCNAFNILTGHMSRLNEGFHTCSGRVEVLNGESWVTVCDADFDLQDAEVVCRELGCGSPCGSAVAVLGSDWFGEGSGRIWADVFDCQGNETHLSKCPISSWSRTACSHIQDAGVICSVRLSGRIECKGEVEVFFRQDWRRVLLDSWSESEASVVCRQLGCGSVLNISSSSSSSSEHSYMCVTAHKQLTAAPKNSSTSPALVRVTTADYLNDFTKYLNSSKFNRSIRLVGSGGDCAGRLEVFHSGSWGTVSDELWDIEDAQVVCRQLQCGVALSDPVPARFGSGTGPIWLNEVECEGNEASLWNCRYQLCGEDECGHKDDVGVVCSDPSSPAVPLIYPVSLLILGSVLFLALVLLVVLFYQNRVLRRGTKIQYVTPLNL
uniref:SRCR domain-containing protein n=1 Tax=Astyanax mexicanus TaxID=7994 RepID=A0A3B1JMR6_ASTMX